MSDLPPLDLPWLVAAAATLLFVLALVAWWRARTRLRRANRKRGRRARRAESKAERWLESLGFAVLDRQVTGRWDLAVDGEVHEVGCRADLLLELDGRCYVADVKTGRTAPDPRHPPTRRQLLEYRLAFDADGVLVVDMGRRRVRQVTFPGLLRDAGGRPRPGDGAAPPR